MIGFTHQADELCVRPQFAKFMPHRMVYKAKSQPTNDTTYGVGYSIQKVDREWVTDRLESLRLLNRQYQLAEHAMAASLHCFKIQVMEIRQRILISRHQRSCPRRVHSLSRPRSRKSHRRYSRTIPRSNSIPRLIINGPIHLRKMASPIQRIAQRHWQNLMKHSAARRSSSCKPSRDRQAALRLAALSLGRAPVRSPSQSVNLLGWESMHWTMLRREQLEIMLAHG